MEAAKSLRRWRLNARGPGLECPREKAEEMDGLYGEIVGAYKAGNQEAFGRLMERYLEVLRGIDVFPCTGQFYSTSFVEFLVHFLKEHGEDESAGIVLECCKRLADMSGDIEEEILKTDMIEVVVSLLKSSPKWRRLLISVVACLSGFEEELLPCVVGRLFREMSIDDLVQLAGSRVFSGDKEMCKNLALIIAYVTRIEPPPGVQVAVLRFVNQCYEHCIEAVHFPNLWTLWQLTGFQSFFESDNAPWNLFCELRLNLFLDDMMFHESDSAQKCAYFSMCVISNVYEHVAPPVPYRFDGILQHALGEDDMLSRAAVQAMTRIVTKDKTLLDLLVQEQKLYDVLGLYDKVGFQTKELIGNFVATVVCMVDDTVLRPMMADGIIAFLNGLLEFDSPEVILSALGAIRYLVEYFDERGCIGFFNMHAAGNINMDRISEIATQPKSQLTRRAAVVESLLVTRCSDLFAV